MNESVIVDALLIDRSMLLNILLAIVLGFIIGLEREVTNKWAGLRTHILVCLGSCVFTLLSIYAFPIFAHSPQADPARIAAQVLTGIGFIGGGTVLRHGSSIYGLTTAATLWITASIGMACGCGFRMLATVAAILSVAVLVLIRIFEKEYLHRDKKIPQKFKVAFLCTKDSASELYTKTIASFKSLYEIHAKRPDEDNMVKIDFRLCLTEENPIEYLRDELGKIEGTESISIQEVYE